MSNAIALLASALALHATADVQLLPAGEFTGRDGRPGNGLTWKLSDQAGRDLAAKLNARHASVRFNMDYEHQAMLTEKNGQPAPASGWVSKFEWRSGQGLFALNVQWTARAKRMIETGEYAYLSPVIAYDKRTGAISNVINASLTNIPALDQRPLAESGMARLNAIFRTAATEGVEALTSSELAVCRATGIDPEAFAETRARLSAEHEDDYAGQLTDDERTILRATGMDPGEYLAHRDQA